MSEPNTVIPNEILHGRREDILRGAAANTAPTTLPIANSGQTNAIEDLIMLGYLSKTATIGKFSFKLKTLSNEEKVSAYSSIPKLAENTVETASKLRDVLLARSVVSVNGQQLEYFYAGAQKDLPIHEKRLEVINKLSTPVLDKLFALYTSLEDEAAKVVDNVKFDDVKNS